MERQALTGLNQAQERSQTHLTLEALPSPEAGPSALGAISLPEASSEAPKVTPATFGAEAGPSGVGAISAHALVGRVVRIVGGAGAGQQVAILMVLLLEPRVESYNNL